MLKLELNVGLKQNLNLTPQLQQFIKWLQMPTLEFSQEINNILNENPFLEKEDFDEIKQNSLEDYEIKELEELNWFNPNNLNSEESNILDSYFNQETLYDYLHKQVLLLKISELEKNILNYLIDNLNENGYLEDSLEDLVLSLIKNKINEKNKENKEKQFKELLRHFEIALNNLQKLEPIGVGARNLNECLKIQLINLKEDLKNNNNLNLETINLALELCDKNLLEIFKNKKLNKFENKAINLVKTLETKPGRKFFNIQSQEIIPDVIVKFNNRKLVVELNNESLPKLNLNYLYSETLKNYKKTHRNLKQKLTEANWLINSIQQRFKTILKVAKFIVNQQKNFFVHGEMAMKSLLLSDVAKKLNISESTVSRATKGKYILTPRGIYELKYFFNSSLSTETGGNASSTAIKALIKKIIEEENKNKPLSDEKIVKILIEEGINCSRRTINKYRESMKIPATNLRRKETNKK